MQLNLKLFAKQREYISAYFDKTTEQIGYGGARGGGKSHVLRAAKILRRVVYPGTTGLLIRRTVAEVRANHRDQVKQLCQMYDIPVRYVSDERTFHFPRGGKLILGYMNRAKDLELYQGNEYDDIDIDELTQHAEINVQLLFASCRSTPAGAATMCMPKRGGSCNPGGVGHKWVKKHFVEERTRDPKTVWVQARLRDNVHLLKHDPEYGRRLVEGLPPWKISQWLDGDWDVVEGAYFSIPPSAIRKVDIPYHAKVTAGVDWGYYPSAFAVVYVARWKDSFGRDFAHVFQEIKRHRLELDEQAYEVKELEKTFKLPCRSRFADPSVWKKEETESTEAGRTIHRVWAKHGFNVLPARSRARIPGWQLLRLLLFRGVLSVDPDCLALIDELQSASYESDGEAVTGEDIDEACEDHSLDALRYNLVSTFGLTYVAASKGSYAEKPITSLTEYLEFLSRYSSGWHSTLKM